MTPYLVSTEWLHTHLEDPAIRIVDIRGQSQVGAQPVALLDHYEDYVQSHIPNAAFINWVADISDDSQHKRIAPVQAYASAMGRAGITNDHFVVAYCDSGSTLAARLWWSLQYYGHTQAAVLNGGWQKWRDEGRPTTDRIPPIETARFAPRPNPRLLRQGDEILHLLGSTTRIVDMRLPEEYSGELSLTRFSGHIPGAVNLPAEELLTADGTLLSAEELLRRFEAVGVDESAPEVIFYSNVGVASCLGILAMRAAGLSPLASNYDASWQEWGSDGRKPRAAG